MLVAAELDWNVNKRPMLIQGTDIVVPDMYALQRDKDGKVFGVCGPKYEPYANSKVFTFFDKFVKAGKMEMHTAGSLKDGRHVWALAKMKDKFVLKGKDEVDSFILLSHPHIWGKSLVIMHTPIRVVCWNTLTWALENALGAKFRLPHIYAFDEQVMDLAEETLGLAHTHFAEYKDKAHFLASKDFTEDTVNHYVASLMQPELVIAKGPQDDTVVDFAEFKRNAWLVRQSVETQPGKDLPTKHTWWAAYNAVTYAVDHEFGNERDTALQNAWFGRRAQLKRDALDLAVEYAEAA